MEPGHCQHWRGHGKHIRSQTVGYKLVQTLRRNLLVSLQTYKCIYSWTRNISYRTPVRKRTDTHEWGVTAACLIVTRKSGKTYMLLRGIQAMKDGRSILWNTAWLLKRMKIWKYRCRKCLREQVKKPTESGEESDEGYVKNIRAPCSKQCQTFVIICVRGLVISAEREKTGNKRRYSASRKQEPWQIFKQCVRIHVRSAFKYLYMFVKQNGQQHEDARCHRPPGKRRSKPQCGTSSHLLGWLEPSSTKWKKKQSKANKCRAGCGETGTPGLLPATSTGQPLNNTVRWILRKKKNQRQTYHMVQQFYFQAHPPTWKQGLREMLAHPCSQQQRSQQPEG